MMITWKRTETLYQSTVDRKSGPSLIVNKSFEDFCDLKAMISLHKN